MRVCLHVPIVKKPSTENLIFPGIEKYIKKMLFLLAFVPTATKGYQGKTGLDIRINVFPFLIKSSKKIIKAGNRRLLLHNEGKKKRD